MSRPPRVLTNEEARALLQFGTRPHPGRRRSSRPRVVHPPRAAIRFSITIPGEPQSKERPRVRNGVAYTPRATKDAEARLQGFLMAAVQGVPDGQRKYGVRVIFHCQDEARDIDNMQKLVFDAAQGIVWANDRQVEEVYSRVWRGSDDPRTELSVYPLDDPA